MSGCLPINGLRLLTLECFYNASCVSQLFLLSNVSTIFYPILNKNLPTRFIPISSTLIGTLIDKLFIETWLNSSNYLQYYSMCSPSICQYTSMKRSDVIYMLTTFLGLYGGLTVGTKFIVWDGLCLYRKFTRCCTIRRYQIKPQDDNWFKYLIFSFV
jgi:hypothetical protein